MNALTPLAALAASALVLLPQIDPDKHRFANVPVGHFSVGVPGASSPCVAFSGMGSGHTSNQNDDLLTFSVTADHGGAWDGQTFTAPVHGFYYVSMDFVRTSFLAGTFPGTSDDVYMKLLRNGTYVGKAWAGESEQDLPDSNWSKRMTGAYSTVIELNAGDQLSAWAGSDGIPGKQRTLAEFHIAGFLICKP